MGRNQNVTILSALIMFGSLVGCDPEAGGEPLDDNRMEDTDAARQAVYTEHAIITCQDATMYANACGPDGPKDVIKVLPYGDKVGLRPNAGCESWAVILDYGPDNWGFVLRECFTTCNGPNSPIPGCF